MTLAADHTPRPVLWSCGTLGKAHGLAGEIYLNLSVDGLRRLEGGAEFFLVRPGDVTREGDEQLVPCAVTRAGGTAERPLVRLAAVSTREEARALLGCELLAAGGALDDLPHYRIGDVVGVRVETASGRPLGVVDDVLETPAHEILQVRAPDGSTLLVPLVTALVAVDEAAGVARVVDGLLDEAEERPPDDRRATTAPGGEGDQQ